MTASDGRQAVKVLKVSNPRAQDAQGFSAGVQSVGKVGPDTKCGQCGRVMDEGEVAVFTAPTWPPGSGFTGYQCLECILPPKPPKPPEPPAGDPVTQARLAAIEARLAALESRLS